MYSTHENTQIYKITKKLEEKTLYYIFIKINRVNATVDN